MQISLTTIAFGGVAAAIVALTAIGPPHGRTALADMPPRSTADAARPAANPPARPGVSAATWAVLDIDALPDDV